MALNMATVQAQASPFSSCLTSSSSSSRVLQYSSTSLAAAVGLGCSSRALRRSHGRERNFVRRNVYDRAVCRALMPDGEDGGSESAGQEEGSDSVKFQAKEDVLAATRDSDPTTARDDNSTTYALITGLAGLGFAETVYLTYMKLTGGPVSCPIGGESCNDVLNSDYGVVFGLPLSAVGVLAYGTVAFLGALSIARKPLRVINTDVTRWFLLGSTSAMASASAYFMYILSTKLEGASCAYCVASALLSISLVLLTLRVRGPFFGKPWNMDYKCMLKGFGAKEIKQVAGLQLAVTASVIVALSSAYAGVTPALTGSSDINLPPVEPLVTTSSTSATISLAKHLQSIGAKMYGAFWCSHCYEQKQMFGREAMKYIEYVECYPEGYRRGVNLAKACEEAKITGFPTWIFKGETVSGEQKLAEIARMTGFDGFESSNTTS